MCLCIFGLRRWLDIVIRWLPLCCSLPSRSVPRRYRLHRSLYCLLRRNLLIAERYSFRVCESWERPSFRWSQRLNAPNRRRTRLRRASLSGHRGVDEVERTYPDPWLWLRLFAACNPIFGAHLWVDRSLVGNREHCWSTFGILFSYCFLSQIWLSLRLKLNFDICFNLQSNRNSYVI